MFQRIVTAALCIGVMGAAVSAKDYALGSPSGKLVANISAGDGISYYVSFDGKNVIAPSALSMTLSDGHVVGDGKVRKAVRKSVDETVSSPLYRRSEVRDNYNALTLKLEKGWEVQFRAYDDGFAYRFVSTSSRPFEVVNEEVEYAFPGDATMTVPYVAVGNDGDFNSQFFNSFENTYTTASISRLKDGRLSFLPLVADGGNGVKVCLTETDLNDYPGLYLTKSANGMKGVFAPYPLKVEKGGYNNIQGVVKERASYIAKVDGARSFPWRVAVVGSDKEIAMSDLSWLLAEPSKISDVSWIKPGKVAWDWWNHWNITGVDFEAGINTETYKHYIGFAAENGIEYVIIDDGWAAGKGEDLMKINPDIDLKELVAYANGKNVDIILWAGYDAFNRDMENVCRHYADMGIKGFKVDFLDRDDQLMTRFSHRAAAEAAKHRLVLDMHGTYKPAGQNRTWPNVLNFEGVHGLEQMKWDPIEIDQMAYDVTIPFIRQVAGPMDYTQGAMRNATRGSFHPCNEEPMSQGTRCHQLALYTVLEAPLNMLCDSPSNYRREKESTDFIAGIPTVWDESMVLAGEMGKYIVTARRSGDVWYLGGVTDWTPRDVEVDLTPLKLAAGAVMTLFTDGVNAHRNATDYKRTSRGVQPGETLRVHMAPGGGFAARIAR